MLAEGGFDRGNHHWIMPRRSSTASGRDDASSARILWKGQSAAANLYAPRTSRSLEVGA